MKIIAFTFAGGSRYSYPKFSKNVTDFVVLEYPGRGMKTNEKLINEVDLLIENLLPKVMEEINNSKEYIIYGHSMGALIGYLICNKLQELNIKQPVKLVVSGKNPPSIERKEKLFHLPNTEFWGEVIKIGGIPDELNNHSELMEFYIPILKADFHIIENYNHKINKKLNIPIDVFYGTEEKITEEEIMDWKNETTGIVNIKVLEGNHFFINQQESFFVDYFNSLNNYLIYR